MPIWSTYIDHLTLSSKTFWRLRLLTHLSKTFSLSSSSTLVPTHEHIARLILDQKSPSQALQTFKWASDFPNFTHSQSTYRALVLKLCNFRHFNDVHQVLEEMPASIGSPPDEDIFVTFISGLGRAQRIKEVIRVLDLVVKFDMQPSMKIYNSILDVLVKEDIDIARGFYRKKMMDCGVKGDDYTFGILMKGLCLTNRIADGFKLLQLIKSRSLKPNTVVYNTLLHALCKNRKVGRARSLMNEMPDPNGVTYNILVSAYCEEGNMVQAIVLLEKCFSSNLVPDIITVTKVAEMLCNVGRVNEAVEIMDRFEVNGGKMDVVAYNTLIKGFCDIGKARVAVRYLKEMERKGCFPSADTYNELIHGFCEIDMVDLALEFFNDMKTDGISWNFVTFETLIKGLCSKGFVDEGFKILELMEDHIGGSGGRISPYNSILYGLYLKNHREEALSFLSKMKRMFPRAVDRTLKILGFCEEGSVGDAMKVYEQMIKESGLPSVFVYARLIHSLGRQNCVKEAFDLMNEMISLKYFPISSTYNVLISGFCSQGKVSSALNLLEDMVGRRCLPDSGAYNPIINVFCQKGDLENALEILQQMVDADIVPTLEMWTSLVFLISKEKLGMETRGLSCINSQMLWIVQP